MAARPGRGPARREGGLERLASEPIRKRGVPLHLAGTMDPDRERLLTDYDAAMGVALSGLETAFVEAEGSWAQRMRAALDYLLELAAANPELTRLCTVDVFEAGRAALDHRDRWILRFMRLCEVGYAQSGATLPPPLASRVAAGSILELVRSHVLEGRLSRLEDALPAATLIVLSPIVGRDEALRIAEPAPF